jgi:mannose-1-phosphate guanylyltransferase/mannose-6-phosphate isomerase
MKSSKFQPCILSGGAGNRLWPFSRENHPKQFLDLAGRGRPLLIEAIERLAPLAPGVAIMTHKDLQYSTLGLLKRYGIEAGEQKVEVIGEPMRRNTAAAIALFVWKVVKEDPKAIVGFFPADHLVEDRDRFQAAVSLGIEKAREARSVVVLGICPTEPSDAYGYVEVAAAPNLLKLPVVEKALRFIEKPSVDRAERFLQTGRFFWNAGIFLSQASFLAKLFDIHMPKLWSRFSLLKDDLSNLREVYDDMPMESFDYGIMEHLDSIDCIVCDPGWSDVGSWEQVAKESDSATKTIEVNGRGNSYVSLAGTPRQTAFVGVSDVIVSETPDSILILKKGEGQRLRDVVQTLKKIAPKLVSDHVFEERPWGSFEVLLDGKDLKVKRLIVLPGQRLSYQSHTRRDENWTIIKGLAEITLNDEVKTLKAGEHIFIPRLAKHRVANRGKEDLVFVEVQTGTYFGEDDITRYSDDYGRSV